MLKYSTGLYFYTNFSAYFILNSLRVVGNNIENTKINKFVKN